MHLLAQESAKASTVSSFPLDGEILLFPASVRSMRSGFEFCALAWCSALEMHLKQEVPDFAAASEAKRCVKHAGEGPQTRAS